jgi:membrane peptidoglycan carboxypeptidase
VAGGSTITQQTARLLLLDPQQQAERSLQRKLKEMVLALQLNGKGKDAILELYLNQVYFGNLAYGIEAAARTYFQKGAAELSLAECALLAGIVQNAVLNDPLANFEGAKARQGVALRLMVQNGYLTQAEAEIALKDELQFGATPFPIEAPHFVMAVWKQLERRFPTELHRGGLEVITTVDLDWQNTAQRIVQQQLNYLNYPINNERPSANARNAAVVAIDPYTGQVLTMLGSPDYFDESIDGAVNAALALRQPGSALKPFTYALAFDPRFPDPYTPSTVLLDIETPFVTRRFESYTPANFGLVEHGPVSVREALASSYNIPAVIALEHVGLERFTQFMADVGLEDLAANTNVDLSITLGGGEVRLLDLVHAYGVFPTGGNLVEPTFILKITDQHGATVYEAAPPAPRQVLDERSAYLITDILNDNNARIPSFGAQSPLLIGRPAAAKTGTTTDFRDNWVVGYTPNLVVGVWVGNADNTPMVEVTGVSGAGPIYNLFLRQVLLGQPELDFARPDGLIEADVCALSGKLPTPQCPHTVRDWFIPGTTPTQYDDFYQVLAIDRTTGRLATEDTPPEQRIARTYIILPPEARDWGIRNGIEQPPSAALMALTSSETEVRLLEPDPYTVFEVSPLVPLENQRLRLIAAAPADTQAVTYFLNNRPIGTAFNAPWEVWWTLQFGNHELTIQATSTTGSLTTSDEIPFSVVDSVDGARLIEQNTQDVGGE